MTLREMRNSKGFSAREVAALLAAALGKPGYDTSTVLKAEANGVFDVRTLQAYATVYDATLENVLVAVGIKLEDQIEAEGGDGLMNDGSFGPYVAGIMDAHNVQPKQVAILSGEDFSTVSRLRTGSRPVNQRQACQILIALGRAIELNTKKGAALH